MKRHLVVIALLASLATPAIASAEPWPGPGRICGADQPLIRRNACVVLENYTVGFIRPGMVSTANGFTFSVTGKDEKGRLTPNFNGLAPTSIWSEAPAEQFKPNTWLEAACEYSAIPKPKPNAYEGCSIFGQLKIVNTNEGLARAAAKAADSPLKFDASNYTGDYYPIVGQACQANMFVTCQFVSTGSSPYSYYAHYKLVSHPLDVEIRNDTKLNLVIRSGKCAGNKAFDYRGRNDTARPQTVKPGQSFHAGYYAPTSGILSCMFVSSFENDKSLPNEAEGTEFYHYLAARVNANGDVVYNDYRLCSATSKAKPFAECPSTDRIDKTSCDQSIYVKNYYSRPVSGAPYCNWSFKHRASITGVSTVTYSVYIES